MQNWVTGSGSGCASILPILPVLVGFKHICLEEKICIHYMSVFFLEFFGLLEK